MGGAAPIFLRRRGNCEICLLALSDEKGVHGAYGPTLLAISGTIYDVTPRRDFYGPGGPYEAFAGRECAVALAKMSFEESDLHANVSALDDEEREKLQDWIETFEGKYDVVGQVRE